jgi:hypothetical protein
MPKLNVPKKTTELKAFFEQDTADIIKSVQEAIHERRDKQFMARLFDLHMKKTNKLIESVMVDGNVVPENVTTREELIECRAMTTNYQEGNIEEALTKLNVYFTPEIIKRNADQWIMFNKIKRDRQAVQAARNTLALSPDEEENVYRSYDSIYKEQVQKRKFYHHDLVGVLLRVIPPLHALWKQRRNETENIHRNEMDYGNYNTSRNNRMNFKKAIINEVPAISGGIFFIKCIICDTKIPPKFVTKHKDHRNQFFSTHRYNYFDRLPDKAISEDLSWGKESKEADEQLRVEIGIR